jgi:hypothetical protein
VSSLESKHRLRPGTVAAATVEPPPPHRGLPAACPQQRVPVPSKPPPPGVPPCPPSGLLVIVRPRLHLSLATRSPVGKSAGSGQTSADARAPPEQLRCGGGPPTGLQAVREDLCRPSAQRHDNHHQRHLGQAASHIERGVEGMRFFYPSFCVRSGCADPHPCSQEGLTDSSGCYCRPSAVMPIWSQLQACPLWVDRPGTPLTVPRAPCVEPRRSSRRVTRATSVDELFRGCGRRRCGRRQGRPVRHCYWTRISCHRTGRAGRVGDPGGALLWTCPFP